MTLAEEVAHRRVENAALQACVAQREQQLTAALARIAELEQQRRDPPPCVKPNKPARPDPPPPRKKRAAQHNHSRRREPPTPIVGHALSRCPDCNDQLRGASIDYPRQVIELPSPPPLAIIEHQIIKRFCPKCRRWQHPQLDLRNKVLGRGRIGVRLAALIGFLRTPLRLPLATIRHYLRTLHQLTLSVGGIQEIFPALRAATQPALHELKQQARRSRILHADETSWRENGQNGYVWSFSTPGEDAVRY